MCWLLELERERGGERGRERKRERKKGEEIFRCETVAKALLRYFKKKYKTKQKIRCGLASFASLVREQDKENKTCSGDLKKNE